MKPCCFGKLPFVVDTISLVPHEVNPDQHYPAGSWNSAEVIENATQASMGNEPHSRTQVPVGTCYPKMQSIYTVMAEQREQEYQDQLRQQAVYSDHSQQQGSEFVTVDHIHQQESSCHAEDYMTWSVFSMLFTCLCIGLGAFHYSRETRVYNEQGRGL